MELSPQDLGEARRSRLASPMTRRPERISPTGIGLIVTGLVICCCIHVGGTVPVVLLALLTAKSLFLFVARREQPRQDTPLTPSQMQGMIAQARDPLEREYLGAVLAAMMLPPVSEATAETQVREAIRALGAAIEQLPPPGGAPPSAPRLTNMAAALWDEAEREADPVVAATLRRRAETRERQAQTTTLIETLGRRNAALRQELSDQIDSLQTSLAAFRLAGVWSVGEMAEVSAGIQWVALKANALAAARLEMDDALQTGHVPNPFYNGLGGTHQRLARYVADDTEV